MKSIVNILPSGKDFHIWYYENDIKKHEIVTDFEPYFYGSFEDKGIFARIDDIEKIILKHPAEMKKERTKYSYTAEADVSYHNRFLIDTFYKAPIPEAPLRIAYIDIENHINEETKEFPDCHKAEFPITAISIKDNKTKKLFTFGWHPTQNWIDKENNIYIFENELEALSNFSDFWKKFNFDIITGWNVDGYDIPYLHNRLNNLKFINALSPIKQVFFDTYRETYNIAGISVLDYMVHYMKRSQNEKESYSLNNISSEELGEKKVEYDGSLRELWEKDMKKYVEYNRQDVELVYKLDKKLQYISLADGMRRIGRCIFDDVLQNSKIYDNLILCTLKQKGKCARTKGEKQKAMRFKGAFVGEPVTGIHEWITDLDATALYPSIIMALNLSPEIKSALDGKGIIPEIIEMIVNERKKYKDKYKETRSQTDYMTQWSYKILANSLYGVFGYEGFRFYDIKLAEKVTSTGQKIIKFARRKLEEKGYPPIYSDTDSTFLKLKDVKDLEDAKKQCVEIQDYVNGSLKEIEKELGVPSGILYFKQEIIARRALFFEKKKRYVLWVLNDEGKDCDEIKYTGVETVRSDTPRVARKFLKKFYKMIVKDNSTIEELQDYCNNFKKGIKDIPREDLGLPMGIKGLLDDYKSNSIHVRGAKFWNTKYLPKIKGNIKVKYYYIHNIESDVISVPDGHKIPDEIKIDYERMIERLVDMKVTKVFEILGKTFEKKVKHEYW